MGYHCSNKLIDLYVKSIFKEAMSWCLLPTKSNTLLEPKVISLCHLYRVMPACRCHSYCLTRGSYNTVNLLTSNSDLDIPKIDNVHFQNGRRTSKFKKFSRLRVR